MTTSSPLLLWSILGVALVVSVVTDVLWRRIPDAVTGPALLALLAVRGWQGGWGTLETGLLSGVVAAAGVAALFALLARGDRMGWGDVKLMAVVGAAFGFPTVQWALVCVALVGALQALVLLLWQGALWDTLAGALRGWAERAGLVAEGARAPARHIPYGVAIALGSFWTMWWDRAALTAP